MARDLAYLAAGLITAWGIAHALPTRQVVRSFGVMSTDNRLVITQEWLVEAFSMWFIAALLTVVTALAGPSVVVHWVYRVTAAALIALAALTAATGARTPPLWFRGCVVLLLGTAGLLIVASLS